MSTDCLLGIDVGASRTRALLAGLDGKFLGYDEAGPGNPETVGYEGLAAAMREALSGAMGAACFGGAELKVVGAGFGVAGFDWESERADTAAAIAKLGLSCPVVLKNDAALGLAAGSSEGWGINVAAGTSNNCYGLSQDGREGSLAGGGGLLGENGGALEIVGAALVQINYARIKRGPPTALTGLFCARAAISPPDADAFVEGLTNGGISPKASWAPDVFAAARAGDEVAASILAWAGSELGESAAAVARQVGIENEGFEVVLSGSLFDLKPPLERGVTAVLEAAAPRARVVHLKAPPVLGAILFAARALGLDPRPLKTRLLSSLAGFSGRDRGPSRL